MKQIVVLAKPGSQRTRAQGLLNTGAFFIDTIPTGLFAGRKLQRAVRGRGLSNPIIWCCCPEAIKAARRMPRSALVYDASWGQTCKNEAALAAAADVILVSTAEQEKRVAAYGKPVLLLPNGVDFAAARDAAERNLPFPDDLFNVQNPIIGHLGAVDRDVDLLYIEAAAKAHPEWSFVFVGAVQTDTAPVAELKNVHLLGHKPQKLLPVYAARFDICVNTAKNSAWDASPMKLYEYLATGKPIVSTPHPAQVLDYTEVVYLAGTHEEFITCCHKAIKERDAWKTRRRIEYGRAASWDARAAELERMLIELGVF